MIEKILAEIERLKKEYRNSDNLQDVIRYDTISELLSFIDSLEKEPEVDLEKELEKWRHDHFKGKRDGDYNGEYLERESQLDLARHFYELGRLSNK